MQYENVFKSDRNVHVILAFLKVLLLLKLLRRWLLRVLLRWLNVCSEHIAKTKQNIKTFMRTKANTKKHYTIT